LLTACLTILAGGCWLITGTIRLEAAPQVVNDPTGVSVDTRGMDLLHRDAVPYPAEAMAKGIQGTVAVNVQIGATGNVAGASVVSGPAEWRKAVLQSVLDWHFAPAGAANTTRVIDISFVLPAGAAQPVRAAAPQLEGPKPPQGAVIKSIQVIGLSDHARDQLLATLPAHVGESASPDTLSRILETLPVRSTVICL